MLLLPAIIYAENTTLMLLCGCIYNGIVVLLLMDGNIIPLLHIKEIINNGRSFRFKH